MPPSVWQKLIGVYEYGSPDSPDGEVEGVKVGDIVDYMTYGYYQNQNPNGAFGREESHLRTCPNPSMLRYLGRLMMS